MSARPADRYDLCVIGGSAGGLAVAIGAALLGVRVPLIEAGPLGADTAAALARAAFLAAPDPHDLDAVRCHVAATLAAAAPASAVERLQALGIDVIRASACFTGADRVVAGGRSLAARRFVLAPTGRPERPAISGLDAVPYATGDDGLPETVARHLAILGGGAEALELAQAHRRLGSAVTVIAPDGILADEDPELVEPLLLRLRAEGIRLVDGRPVAAADGSPGAVRLMLDGETIEADRLLVAAGRRSDLAPLDLDRGGIVHGQAGIRTDAFLRTTNRRVYAIDPGRRPSDAAAAAAVALRNILFRQRRRFDPAVLPRIVGTAPALAQIGPTENRYRAISNKLTILRSPLHENDRARAEGAAHGLVKVVTDRRGGILGAGLVGLRADELVQVWQLAITERLNIASIAGLISAYPTVGEASKRAAGAFFAPKLLGAGTRRLVKLLAMLS